MNKVAYITGGSKGIGLGIAKSLLGIGYKVAITGRNQSALDTAVNELKSENVLAIQADVRNYEEEKEAVQQVLATWGRMDLCVANAGLGIFTSIEDMTVDQWKDVIDVNLTGVFHSVKASIPPLKESKGYIITIASLAGTNFFKYGSAYNASKFGLVGFSQAIMLDLREHGIKVSTIMPGSVATNFNNHNPSDADAWKIQPEDIGKLVVDLLNMNPRTLPSKVEVRPAIPPAK